MNTTDDYLDDWDDKSPAERRALASRATTQAPGIRQEPVAADAVRALRQIKALVVGDAFPNWHLGESTYATRGRIADICDAALAGSAQPCGHPASLLLKSAETGEPPVLRTLRCAVRPARCRSGGG